MNRERQGDVITLLWYIAFALMLVGFAGAVWGIEWLVFPFITLGVSLLIGTIAFITIADKIERLREEKNKRRTRIEVAKDIFDALVRENGEEK